MKRTIFLSLLFALVIGGGQSKAQSVVNDTLAFRQYLSDNFGTRANAKAIFSLYQRLGKTYTKEEREKRSSNIYPRSIDRSFSGDNAAFAATSPSFNLSNTSSYGYVEFIRHWRVESFLFPDSLRRCLRAEIHSYDLGERDRREDKEVLIQALAAFDSVTINKPIFFADIYSKFKGDYRKYVNHLYKKSILTNSDRMMIFTRRPTTKKLQADPGVLFVIGLALYESWIKDVREGRVKDNQ